MSTKLAPLQIFEECIPYRNVSFNMITVEGGSFLLDGKIKTEISGFQLSQHLVSQELWTEVMGVNPSEWKGKNRPVERVSWYDCIEFCNELSSRMKLEPYYEIDKSLKDPDNESRFDKVKWIVHPIQGANGFRLPTESEWEYAAKGGKLNSTQTFSGTKNLEKVGWYWDNSFKKTHVRGLKLPNALGIYDMSGNLWEWCQDWYQSNYPVGPLKDPKGPKSGRYRVLRGGSWFYGERLCGVAVRRDDLPDLRYRYNGLRLSRRGL